MMVRNAVRRPAPVGSRRVAFTGYRPQKMRLYNTIETLIEQGYKHFLSGGALGMDMFAAEAVLELKHKYPDIVLEMVSPFDAQAAKWAPQYQRRHDWLFEEADIVTATGHEYTKSAMFARNRYLVDNADVLLAAYDGQPGGTQMTIQYAKQTGIQVCCIKPVV